MNLWIKVGIPIAVLTLVAVGVLLSQGDNGIASAAVVVLGLATILFTRHSLDPLDDVTRVIEGIADGDLRHERIQEHRKDEIGRLARSTNLMIKQLRSISEQAEDVAQGKIGAVDIEDKVLKSGRLYDADIATRADHGDLEKSFIRLSNQMRRLTIQARVISQDNLHSPLLDERIPGELGDSFALMVKNLRTIADRAKDIAGGDLTSYVEGEGDLTSAFNQMVTGLNDLVQQIMGTALQISTASEEILIVLQEQEGSATHQASGVEETQRTMETLLSSARKIADSTQTVFKSAEKTQANNRIVGDRIGELKAHTARIAEILEIIKSIADRSDLLALNASLEGMRAGEAGKGFTLVAAEMRRLAENIKDSIGDIKELVSDIRESSLASVMATEEGSHLSEQTTETALKISLITQQQQSGTEQVTQSMEELSHLINQGVAGTRQVTTAARELAHASDALRNVVDNFQVADEPQHQKPGSTRLSANLRKSIKQNPRQSLRNSMSASSRPKDSKDPNATIRVTSEHSLSPKRSPQTTPVNLSQSSVTSQEENTDSPSENDSPSQDVPTVEFSAASSENSSIFDDIAASLSKSSDPDGSQEFDSIARQIEGDDEEEETETS